MTETPGPPEVDALLQSLSETEARVITREDAARPPVGPYDFAHPDLLSREQVRALRTLHEGYAQALAKRLSTELLTNLSATVLSVDQATFGEFLRLLPAATVLAVVEVPELAGNMAIELSADIAFSFVDRLLGGPGRPLARARALTAIEMDLVRRVLEKACRELEMIWRPIRAMRFQLQSIEGNPELARVVEGSEMIVQIVMELRMNEASGRMVLCLPHVVIEPATQQLAQGMLWPRAGGGGAEGARPVLESTLRSCSVRVDVDLGELELTLRQVLALEVGDVLPFSPASELGARASIQGVPRLQGAPGTRRRYRAFEVGRPHPVPEPKGARSHERTE